MADLRWEVREGDSRDLLRAMPDASVDAIVCDPPYELGFMGKAWDASGIAYSVPLWTEALRVLKPGGHLLAFGGSRTYHRMACAIEDAGFQIRDSLVWIYGSGFPKSLDISKGIDRKRDDRAEILEVTAWVRETRDRKGLANADIDRAFGFVGMASHWTSSTSQPAVPTLDQLPTLLAALGVRNDDVPPRILDLVVTLNERKGTLGDAWRNADVVGKYVSKPPALVGRQFTARDNLKRAPSNRAAAWSGWGTALKPAQEPIVMARKPLAGTIVETVLRYGTGGLNVDGCRIASSDEIPVFRSSHVGRFIGRPADVTIARTGETRTNGRWPANVLLGHAEECGDGCAEGCPVAELDRQSGTLKSGAKRGGAYARSLGVHDGGQRLDGLACYADSGGASRFFYTAKPSARERDAGLGHLPTRAGHEVCDREEGSAGASNPRAGIRTQRANVHPTVKPIELMRYLVRLITPPGGLVLDPFTGSGTTGCAAVLEGARFLGLELSPEYAEIARARIAHWAPTQAELWPAAE